MKVIFFGTPTTSVPYLKMLQSDEEIEVLAVVTQPDKPIGRKKELNKPPVKIFAEQNNIKIFQPKKVKENKDFIKELSKLEADFFIVVAYGMILPEEVINIPKISAVNVHYSLLPKYRGATPVQTALLNGDRETGISFMKINEKLDTGSIYLLKKVEIDPNENTDNLMNRMSDLGAILLPSTLRDIEDGVLTPLPQEDTFASYCTKIQKQDAFTDPNKETAEHIYNKLRAYTPWPLIYIEFNNKKLKIITCKLSNEKAEPGNLFELNKKLILGTKKGALELLEVQLEGKNKVTADQFINGFLR